MNPVDHYVDVLEDAIAERGVQSVDIREIATSIATTEHCHPTERSKIVVELLRVWMEHRWNAEAPVCAEACLALFPDIPFSDEDKADLRSEEERQIAFRSGSTRARGRPIPPVDLLPSVGQKWGEFELLAELGRGAFAKVYLAKQNDLAERWVALKLTFRESFESHWLASLQHSAIVPIYSTHRVGQVYGICMPYLGNTTLADLQQHRKSLLGKTQRKWWTTGTRDSSSARNALLSTIRLRHTQIDTLVASVSKDAKASSQNGNSVVASESRSSNETDDRFSREPSVATQGSTAAISLSDQGMPLQRGYVDSVAWIGMQLADALAYAHSQGIIHSDVKPANVLLAKDGQPRLLDFNVAFANRIDRGQKEARSEPASMLPLGGTLPYMSPELRQSLQQECSTAPHESRVDGRGDLYSLGAVLFELLTGQLPPAESTVQGFPWDASVSPAMRRIVGKCLEIDPEHRYPDARCVEEDLRAQLERRPLVHQLEPSWFERMLKWAHRHPRASSSLSVATCATILLAALFTGFWLRGLAIEEADWKNRLAVLEQRMPNALSMVSSLRVVPELEPQASAELSRTLVAIAHRGIVRPDGTMQMDSRWDRETHRVPADLKKNVHQLIRIAQDVPWKSPPPVLQGLTVPSQEDPSAVHWALVRDGRMRDAVDRLQPYVLDHPRDYFSWWLLGDCQQAMEEFQQAEQSYTVCIAMEPEISVAYFNRGMARWSQQHWDLALHDYSLALKLAPMWSQCRLNKALCMQAMGQLQPAVQELDAAIAGGYKTVSVYRLRSELHAQLGDTKRSVEDTLAALEAIPSTEPQWIDHGLLQLALDPQKSLNDFLQAAKLNPQSIDARQKLAYTYSELLNDPQSSIEQLDRLVELAPSQPTHRAGRAVLYARLGNDAAAASDLRILENAKISEALVLYQVACIYALLGKNLSAADAGGAMAQKHRADAMRWLARAALQDASIVDVSVTDPDLQWLRQQDVFVQWHRSIQSMRSLSVREAAAAVDPPPSPSSPVSNP